MSEHVLSGYKQTKVGVIPEHWDVVRLEEISDFITKGATPTTYGFEWQDSGISFLRSECVSDDGLNLKAAMFISEDANKHMKRSEIKTGDLLMTITGNVGRVVLLKKPFISGNINQHIARIRIVSEHANTEFVNYFISQNKYRINYYKITTGQAYPQISLTQVRDSIVPLPPLKEQQKIAQVLTTWDHAISKQKSLINSKEKLKKGLMQKLLSGEIRFAGFDGEWEEVRLGEIGKIVTGTTPPTANKEYFDNGTYPWVTPTDITSKKHITVSERSLSQIGLEKGRFVPAGSLLVTCIASIGKNAILRTDGSCNQQINAIFPSNKNNIDYLYYLIEYYSEYLLKYAGKSATPILNKKSFTNLKFSIPLLKEQKKIAQVLTLADKEIELLKDELEALKEQKRGLMQRLLSGEVRTHNIKEKK